MPRRVLIVVLASVLLVACGGGGGDDSDETSTSAVGGADCEMTAAAARRVHDLLLGTPAPALSEAGLVLHERSGDGEAATSTEGSPDGQRDIFVLVNEQKAGVLGLRGKSGSRTLSLTARPGCGAVGFLAHDTAYSAQFTLDGEVDGSVDQPQR